MLISVCFHNLVTYAQRLHDFYSACLMFWMRTHTGPPFIISSEGRESHQPQVIRASHTNSKILVPDGARTPNLWHWRRTLYHSSSSLSSSVAAAAAVSLLSSWFICVWHWQHECFTNISHWQISTKIQVLFSTKQIASWIYPSMTCKLNARVMSPLTTQPQSNLMLWDFLWHLLIINVFKLITFSDHENER
jgi:hypothetical protein